MQDALYLFCIYVGFCGVLSRRANAMERHAAQQAKRHSTQTSQSVRGIMHLKIQKRNGRKYLSVVHNYRQAGKT